MSHAVIFAGHSRVGFGTKPAGAYIIANIFREHGFTATVVDHALFFGPETIDKILDRFVTVDTKFLCFSTTLMGEPGTQGTPMAKVDQLINVIIQKCKSRCNAFTVIGGSKITSGDKTSLPFNYAMIGQGEKGIVAIINHALYGDQLEAENINGTLYVSDKVYGYEEFNSSTYLRLTDQDAVIPGETMPLEFGRGCVFKCSYCTYSLTGKSFEDFVRNRDLLIGDFEHNWNVHGISRYTLTDDTINDSIEKARIWYEAVKAVPHIPIEFGGYMRLELFHKHPEMADLYLEAGLKAVIFGIETFNKKAGSSVGKGFGEKAKDTLEFLRSKWGDKVHIQANFIVGLPHDTKKMLRAQHAWLESSGVVDRPSYHPLFISRQGSILSKEYDSYYKSLPADHFGLHKTAEKRQEWDDFMQHHILWQSPMMNYVGAFHLVKDFRTSWDTLKPTPYHRHGGFELMSLRQFYSDEEFKNLQTIDLVEIARRKSGIYLKSLMATPTGIAPLPERRTSVILPGGGFIPKIGKRTIKIINKG